MTPNPLLGQPHRRDCPTGWDRLPPVPDGWRGYSAMTLAASGVVRLWGAHFGRPAVCSRLYHPDSGAIAGLYTENGEAVKLQGHAGRGSKVLADEPGQQFLCRWLPRSSEPILNPADSWYASLGIKYMPFSRLTHVLVVAGGPADLLDGVVAVCGIPVLRKCGGVPVLCMPRKPRVSDIDLAGLEKIRWPKGVTVLARGAELADQIAEQIFIDVEEWPF